MKVAVAVRGRLRQRGTIVRTRSPWEGLKKMKWQINYPIRGGLVRGNALLADVHQRK